MEQEPRKIPRISVVIPVKNGAATIRSCLDGIFRQTVAGQIEVIVIDSGSTDGTLEILSGYPVRVHPLPPGEFNHGETRNLGVSLAKGEFVVMTVQDATPASEDWIEIMLRHFQDKTIVAVCGQQIVGKDPDKNPIQWFSPVSEAQPEIIRFSDPARFRSLTGKEQHIYCHWDDVNAMYRKCIMQKVPFRKLMFSEDTLWARDALSEGYTLCYDYRARVYHYHHQDFQFYFKRSYIILYQNYKFYSYIRFPKNPFIQVPQVVVRMLKMPIPLNKKFSWIWYNLRLVAAGWYAALLFALIARTAGMRGVEDSQKKFVGYPPQGVQAKKEQ